MNLKFEVGGAISKMSGGMSGLSGRISRADCDKSEVEGEMEGND
jgi:hypothetical protein